MIKKIAHLADIHIPKSITRHDEYREVFNRLYKKLKKDKPDRIVIVGDLVHDFLSLESEQIILAKEFLTALAKIAPVRITRGNHDIRKKNLQRVDSIEAFIKVMDNKKIIYYNESKFYADDNVTWAVWKHGVKDNSPWINDEANTDGQTIIDLFHNPIGGCISPLGYEFNSATIVGVKDFHGHYSMFGDIHLKQYFSDKTKAYCSSLIEQGFAEGDGQFHGYLLWNIETGKVEERPIENDFAYNSVCVNQFTDFSDLDIDVENEKSKMKVRVLWQTYPATRTRETERAVATNIKAKYPNTIISNKNEFIIEDKLDVSDEQIKDINDEVIQEEVFRNYLTEIGTPDEIIDGVIEIDKEVTARMSNEELTSIEWEVIKFSAKNFMSYKDIEMDWRNMDGLYQISGLNTAGKTTIMKLISYLLYSKTLETEKRVKYGDKRYVNNNVDEDFCEGEIVIKANDEYFGIKKKTVILRKKTDEIKAASTGVKYYKLNSPDDELSDDNDIENLTEEDKDQSQILIDKTIGTYENYMRVVMTTSDTLNAVLSNDSSEFIDALLYDSGLDIFDKKLAIFKDYSKEVFKERVRCNVEDSKGKIETLNAEIVEVNKLIKDIETVKIPETNNNLKKGKDFTENLIKKLHNIPDDVYRFNENNAKLEISELETKIYNTEQEIVRLKDSISKLCDKFDEDRYKWLQARKDIVKSEIYDLKNKTTNLERSKDSEKYRISTTKGDIQRLKNEGAKLKEEAIKLSKSKTCPTCGQLIDKDHRTHIDEEIEKLKKEMIEKGTLINETLMTIPPIEAIILEHDKKQEDNQDKVDELSLESDKLLKEIGELTNQKNDFEKRNRLIVEKDNLPTRIENYQLKIDNVNKNIEIYNKSLKEIKENETTNAHIEQAKSRLKFLEIEKSSLNDDVFEQKTLKSQKENEIVQIEELIKKFLIQEKKDLVLDTYKKCTHRNGIPTQLLVTYAIPKINHELHKLLEDVGFNVWLDSDNNDIKLKLGYNSDAEAIDAISGSGKERTFASVCLKFALNQINAKSKPSMFLLDETMGKLTEDSVDEFVEILHIIKDRVKKLLVIEHNHEVSPDYLITVVRDEDGNSSLTIE